VPTPKSILVVDDHPEHLYFFRRVLGEAGYHVIESTNGDDAIIQARESQPSAIILDLVMPRLSGWDVARTLKSDPRTESIAILLVTAFPHQANDAWSGDAECDALLVKPIDPKRLLAELERWA
jgi:CheY-like chemotaxis protein